MSQKKSKATKRAEAASAAQKAAAVRREAAAKERRRRTLFVSLAVVGVLTLIVAVAAAIQAGRDTTGQDAVVPAGVVDTYGLPVGDDAAPVTVEVYEDFMCPFCGQFEAAAGETLKEYAASGDVQVQYRPVAYLDRFSAGSDYSTRSLNALGVVLDSAGEDIALRFHDLLFANQPAEGTTGLSDDQLVALAVEAGAQEDDVRKPIESRAFEGWVKNASDDASKRGYNSTPTVVVNGETVDFQTTEDLLANLRAAVEDALS